MFLESWLLEHQQHSLELDYLRFIRKASYRAMLSEWYILHEYYIENYNTNAEGMSLLTIKFLMKYSHKCYNFHYTRRNQDNQPVMWNGYTIFSFVDFPPLVYQVL